MESLRFRSRIDSWMLVVAFAPVAWILWRVVSAVNIGGFTRELLVAGGVSVLVFGLLLWMFVDTSYELTATELRIRCGPLRATLPLSTIRRVRRSHTLAAGPALSLRRLEIEHGKFDQAIISPLDQAGFIAALVERAPSIVVESSK